MKFISLLIISFFYHLCFAQTDSLSLKKESPKTKNIFGLSIGVDVFNPALSIFDDKKATYILANLQFKKTWFLQAEIGYEKNNYNDLGWNVNVDGEIFKAGINYIISQDKLQKNNIFYVGGKILYSNFNEEIIQAPVRAEFQQTQYISFPTTNAHAFALELPVGARVQLFNFPFFIEAILEPKILLARKSENIDAVIIPGFGVDRSGINIGFYWGITYVIF